MELAALLIAALAVLGQDGFQVIARTCQKMPPWQTTTIPTVTPVPTPTCCSSVTTSVSFGAGDISFAATARLCYLTIASAHQHLLWIPIKWTGLTSGNVKYTFFGRTYDTSIRGFVYKRKLIDDGDFVAGEDVQWEIADPAATGIGCGFTLNGNASGICSLAVADTGFTVVMTNLTCTASACTACAQRHRDATAYTDNIRFNQFQANGTYVQHTQVVAVAMGSEGCATLAPLNPATKLVQASQIDQEGGQPTLLCEQVP